MGNVKTNAFGDSGHGTMNIRILKLPFFWKDCLLSKRGQNRTLRLTFSLWKETLNSALVPVQENRILNCGNFLQIHVWCPLRKKVAVNDYPVKGVAQCTCNTQKCFSNLNESPFFKIEFINALYYYTEDQFVRYTISVPMQSFFFSKKPSQSSDVIMLGGDVSKHLLCLCL